MLMSGDKKEEKSGLRRTVVTNRRARHEYFIEDVILAGIVLVGTEVKSLRAGRANLADAYAKVESGEVWLHNMHITPYKEGNRFNVGEKRSRKLLMRRIEIQRIESATQQKGMSLVPLAVIFQNGFAKIEIGIGKGKKLYDKRESIAEKDREREARREFATRYQ